jgi:hypothetical protein
MPTPGQELSSINFEALIGGPLSAIVKAQAQSAMTTVAFIKEVGFKPLTASPPTSPPTFPANSEVGDPIYVTFKYPKEIPPASPPGAPTYQIQELSVPLLTLVPIPFIRIDLATIDFNAKIDAVEYAKTDSSFGIGAEVGARASWAMASANLRVSTSYQSSSQSGSQVNRTYSMNIHVRAVQDDMPAGMEKVLSILEGAMISTPTTLPMSPP